MHRLEKRISGRIIFVLLSIVTLVMSRVEVTRAAAGDTAADRVLGQPDGTRSACNTIDPEASSGPNAVAIDKSLSPNRVYVADSSNNRVLGYANISLLVNGAPASLVIGQADLFSNSTGTSATSLNSPKAVAVDKLGNLYVADTGNNRVLKYSTPFASGKTAGLAASLVFGQALNFASNQCNFGFSAPPNVESMCSPSGVALDSAGDLFVADTSNNRVLAFKAPFNAAADANVVYGQNGSFSTALVNLGSTTPSAKGLSGPTGLAVDATNNLYVADTGNNRVLKFNTPLINTSANLVFGQLSLFVLNGCNQGGTGNASLCAPAGVAVDPGGDVFIGDTSNNRVLMFKPPIAANPIANFVFGQGGSFSSTQCNGGFGTPPSNATLCSPKGLAVDGVSTGNLWIADNGNNRMLRYGVPLSSASVANLVLGQPEFAHNSANTVDATGLCGPAAVAIDKSVTPNHLWVVDTTNNRVLGYTSAATFPNYAAANIVIGQADFFTGSCNQGLSGPTATTLCAPNAAAVDATGNLYVADGGNNRVLEYTKPFLSGLKANQTAAVVFGQGGNFTTNTGVCPPGNSCPILPPPPGTATAGGMCLPSGVAIDLRAGKGNLYVSDENNNRVLVFKPPFPANPVPSLVLGQSTFTANYANRNNTCSFVFPSASSMSGPDQIATDALGNLYVGDTDNSRVLEYNAPTVSGAAANKVFGQLGNFTGEDCNLDSDAQDLDPDSLCNAEGMAADPSLTPSIYIADTGNNRVLWYGIPLTTNTTADVVIGQPSFSTGSCNFSASAPSLKSLCGPLTPAVDSVGNLYVPDFGNNRVLEYDKPDPPVATPTHTPTPKPTPKPTPRPTSTPKPVKVAIQTM